MVFWEGVPGPSAPCLSHQKDASDWRSSRFLPWNTGMHTKKARATVARKKMTCCIRSPAKMGVGRGQTSALQDADHPDTPRNPKALESGRPGFRSLLCCCLPVPP